MCFADAADAFSQRGVNVFSICQQFGSGLKILKFLASETPKLQYVIRTLWFVCLELSDSRYRSMRKCKVIFAVCVVRILQLGCHAFRVCADKNVGTWENEFKSGIDGFGNSEVTVRNTYIVVCVVKISGHAGRIC